MKRVALITGAGAGIGAAVAHRLSLTNHVVLVDLNAELLSATSAAVKARASGRVEVRSVDVLDEISVSAVVAEVEALLGPVDILVNTVGGSREAKKLEKLTTEAWDSVLRLNLAGTFHCTRAVIEGMKARQWGRIVNFSSLAGRTRSLFGDVAYATAKAGVIGFSRQLAFEVGAHGVTVNVVAPGVTSSERVLARWDAKPPPERQAILDLIPARRLGTVDECAAMVGFLCSEDAGYVNGATIDVNGGLFIG